MERWSQRIYRQRWEQFYQQHFPQDAVSLADVHVPPKPSGAYRLVFVIPMRRLAARAYELLAEKMRFRAPSGILDECSELLALGRQTEPYAVWIKEHGGFRAGSLIAHSVGVRTLPNIEESLLYCLMYAKMGRNRLYICAETKIMGWFAAVRTMLSSAEFEYVGRRDTATLPFSVLSASYK